MAESQGSVRREKDPHESLKRKRRMLGHPHSLALQASIFVTTGLAVLRLATIKRAERVVSPTPTRSVDEGKV